MFRRVHMFVIFNMSVLLIFMEPLFYEAKSFLMKVERQKMDYINKDYLNDAMFKVEKVNRSVSVLFINLDTKVDFKDVVITFEMLQWLNNEYKHVGFVFDVFLCDILMDEDVNVVMDLTHDGIHGNIPRKCSPDGVFPKNKYFLKDVPVRLDVKSSVFLLGNWRSDVKFSTPNDTDILKLSSYSNIEELI